MPNRHEYRALVLRAALWPLLHSLLACSAPPPPAIQTPQSAGEAGKPLAEKTHSPVPVAPEKPPAAQPTPATTVVVEPGVEGNSLGETDLVRIAQAEKERRAQSPRPSIVITNETLLKRPGPGRKSKPEEGKEEISTAGVLAAASPTADLARETQANLWKARALDIRTRLKAINEKVEKLRRLTANMRERFYLSPPQLGRDDSLWQEWGRLQESLSESERDFQSTQKELEMFLEEGRRAGADPGWLATGEELLIQKKEEVGPPPAQAIEPPVIPPPGGHP